MAFTSKKIFHVDNYLNDYFTGKVGKLCTVLMYEKLIMNVKHCKFEFCKVSVGEVEHLLLSINNDTPPGIDNLDRKLLRMVADSIATPICHIFCPQAWREDKVIPLPKSGKAAFTGSNSRPISCQLLANCWKTLYLTKLTTDF
jgi:hypothetical protein